MNHNVIAITYVLFIIANIWEFLLINLGGFWAVFGLEDTEQNYCKFDYSQWAFAPPPGKVKVLVENAAKITLQHVLLTRNCGKNKRAH